MSPLCCGPLNVSACRKFGSFTHVWAQNARAKISALLPFGRHKGYGLSLLDELYAAYIGGSTPTLRNRWAGAEGGVGVGARVEAVPAGEKQTCTFFFQATRPEAMGCDDFAMGRDQAGNVKSVLADILGHGNAAHGAMLPGQIEAEGTAQRGAAPPGRTVGARERTGRGFRRFTGTPWAPRPNPAGSTPAHPH